MKSFRKIMVILHVIVIFSILAMGICFLIPLRYLINDHNIFVLLIYATFVGSLTGLLANYWINHLVKLQKWYKYLNKRKDKCDYLLNIISQKPLNEQIIFEELKKIAKEPPKSFDEFHGK